MNKVLSIKIKETDTNYRCRLDINLDVINIEKTGVLFFNTLESDTDEFMVKKELFKWIDDHVVTLKNPHYSICVREAIDQKIFSVAGDIDNLDSLQKYIYALCLVHCEKIKLLLT